MRVVKGWPQDLPAGQILEGCRNAPVAGHVAGIDGARGTEPGQGGAIGTDQKDCLDQVAACLLDRQRSKIGIIKRAFRHHAVHGQSKLLADLRDRQFLNRRVAPSLFRQPGMGVVDRALPAFDRHIHQRASFSACGPAPVCTHVDLGKAAMRLPQVNRKSSPSGNNAWLA